MKRVAILVFAAAVVISAMYALSCYSRRPQPALSLDVRSHLDSLDATGVVRTFFESGDGRVEAYLWPELASRRRQPNYISGGDQTGRIENLVIRGGDAANRLHPDPGYSQLRQFSVEYVQRSGLFGMARESAGAFVYVGLYHGRWKVESVGSGP